MTRLGVEQSDDLLKLVSGQQRSTINRPYAMCYGGYQFGHWAGQLGDVEPSSLERLPTLTDIASRFSLRALG